VVYLNRRIVLHPARGVVGVNNPNNKDQVASRKEGKEPLLIELYKALCGWLLDYGTQDGVFGYCYLVLTWKLACRAGNTSRIWFRDVTWSKSFDSFSIFFPLKDGSVGRRSEICSSHFSNPLSPLVCPLLSLSLYLTCCFNTAPSPADFLFAGVCQGCRFSNILNKIIIDNKVQKQAMGFNLVDIGTHSIRKGAVTYLASLPGGPPAAATCIRAGWTMGRVKDIYMRYVTSGDQFAGCCLSLLSVLQTDFVVSPLTLLLLITIGWKKVDCCSFLWLG
jgi:hypothetical protein